MFRSLVAKVMWVGRATVFMVGLSVMLALLFGIATTALAGNGRGGIFNLGQKNTVNRLTQLVGAPTSGAMLRVDNDGSGTALELKVGLPTANPADKTTPPMTVDSQAKVTNLNADELDGFDSSELQRGLSSECAVGSSIRSIDANGVVSCEPDNDSGAAEVNRLRTELATTDEGGPNEGRDPVSYTKLRTCPQWPRTATPSTARALPTLRRPATNTRRWCEEAPRQRAAKQSPKSTRCASLVSLRRAEVAHLRIQRLAPRCCTWIPTVSTLPYLTTVGRTDR